MSQVVEEDRDGQQAYERYLDRMRQAEPRDRPSRVLDIDPVGQQHHLWCWASSAQMVASYLARETKAPISEGRCPDGWVCEDEGWPQKSCRVCVRPPGECSEGWVCDQWAGSEDDRWCERCVPEDYQQCAQAERALEREDEDGEAALANCCAPETWQEDDFEDCPAEGWPFEYQSEALEFEYLETEELFETEGGLGWEVLSGEIWAGRPVIFSWSRWEWNHIMVAVGFYEMESALGEEAASVPTRWLLVNEPWPPNNGDQSLIPYEIYLSSDEDAQGPAAGHHFYDIFDIRLVEQP